MHYSRRKGGKTNRELQEEAARASIESDNQYLSQHLSDIYGPSSRRRDARCARRVRVCALGTRSLGVSFVP